MNSCIQSKHNFCISALYGFDSASSNVAFCKKDYRLGRSVAFKRIIVCFVFLYSVVSKFTDYKVIYAYKGGVVTVANFVLVNYQKKNFQLDSVIYPERIKMIMDDGDFLYDLKIYEECRDEFFIKIIDDKRTFNFVLGNLNAIDHLRRLVFESNNKQGYTLKRLEKELFQECLTKEIDFEQMMNVFCQNGVVDGNCRDYLSEREKKFVKNKRQCLRTLKKRVKAVKIVDEALFNILHGELGCTKEDVISTCETLGIKNEIKKEAIQQRFAFYYEKSKNTMTDPKNQYC